MIVTNKNHWRTVGDNLSAWIANNTPRNFYGTNVPLTTNNIMSAITPKLPIYFGPKVLNIVIVSHHYGMEAVDGDSYSNNWSLYDPMKQFIKDNYHNWAKNLTYFYGDDVTRSELDAAGDCGTLFASMLNETFDMLATDSAGEMQPYGWVWKGLLTTLVGYEYFVPDVQAFFALQV